MIWIISSYMPYKSFVLQHTKFSEWHQLLLKLVIKSLSVLDSGLFLTGVREEISRTLTCPQSVRSRPFLLQCSAAALSATPDTRFNPTERVACAHAIRLLAASRHFVAVVDRFLKTASASYGWDNLIIFLQILIPQTIFTPWSFMQLIIQNFQKISSVIELLDKNPKWWRCYLEVLLLKKKILNQLVFIHYLSFST